MGHCPRYQRTKHTNSLHNNVSLNSSRIDNEYKSQIVTPLSFLFSTHNMKFKSFVDPKTPADTLSVCAGSIMFMTNMFSSLNFSKSRAFGPARYGTDRMRHNVANSRLTRCVTFETQIRCPSHIDWNAVDMSINASKYFD